MKEHDLVAEVVRFRSAIDDTDQLAGLCGPADWPAGALLPLIVELEPGSITDLEATLPDGKLHLGFLEEPAVWLRPGGRGPGTVFQGYGAVDVFEAIEAAAARYPIDVDRISLYGFSMGGAGVWYLASHFPDRFSAIAPMGAYNDYRLWKRPGGMTFPLMEWEEPSWRARSAIFLLENLRHVGIWMVHGSLDRAVGGGVDVEHARQSARNLDGLGIPYRYWELPDTGHNRGFMRESSFGEVLGWLVEQRRQREPSTVSLGTYDLHHNSAYWLDVKQFQRYGRFARVVAQAAPDRVTIETDNIQHLVLRPPPIAHRASALRIDGTTINSLDLSQAVGVRRSAAGEWQMAGSDLPVGEKRPHVAGPFGGLFEGGTTLVRGTLGSPEENFYQEWCSRDAAAFFKDNNGGIHRGGIRGASWVDLPILDDVEWLAHSSTAKNAIAYGTPSSNAVLASVADQINVWAEPGLIHVGDRTIAGQGLGLIAVLPFPDESSRYLGIHSGTSPDATTSGAHLNWQLLPDYLVYDSTRALEWGYFDNQWQPVPEGQMDSRSD